ncbi:MAG TPA: lysine--tRNA ligase [Planctomycetes bacterium]|nr:lysine--tRNA ligase [Planctomycetota bacterium]
MTELSHPDRQAKVEAIRAAGRDPYPPRGVPAEAIEALIEAGGTPEEPGPRIDTEVTVAGRLLGMRDFGKLIFAPVLDRTGRIQVGLRRDALTDWWPQRKELDGGDLVAVTGTLGRTQKGQLTVWATEVKLLAKAVAPPPEKWHGLVDVEQRYRRRYVDLWASEGVREVFVKRSRMLSLSRRFLEERGFLEVETPTLHPIAGGATARPFVTHHNALDVDLFLRIAPELYLKRLIVGGLERVFEVSRNFRNEGLSVRHNPEFTMLELYQAQADYRDMIELTEALVSMLAVELTGATEVPFRAKAYDLAAPFERGRYDELFERASGVSLFDEAAVRQKARELDAEVPAELGHFKQVDRLFEILVEDELDRPTFVTHHPAAISPLAKVDPDNPDFAERFELHIGGMEICNGFTELNDPVEQEERFRAQVASLDPESPGEVDIDYIQALEYGMPPTAGLGIGMDRLCMVLTNQDSIRDVLLFPTMRRRPAQVSEEASSPDC